MKLQSFLLTVLFMCFYIMDIKAFSTFTFMDLTICSCRVWIEDSNGNYLAGDQGLHDCSEGEDTKFSFPDQTYTVHAKVEASFEKQKVRGPFNGDTCFRIHGTVDDWKFTQRPC
ncbi:hypothetical protein RhiirC2_709849 [Rhizophagus irregularis]|uniref:Secreted protein n=1 Tax=Rhizophagus irregularis TaxID=588596 RepID=A0A2N1NGU0_9GLOM|nr:hypothetical protein RhiirC2_709849 [Rhizophagus irregularis]